MIHNSDVLVICLIVWGLISALGPILDTDAYLLPYNNSQKKCGCMERVLAVFTSQRQQTLVDSQY